MLFRFVVITLCAMIVQNASAKECWVLTSLHGYMAASTEKYTFETDEFSNPIILCFNDDNTGAVSGDDTQFVKFGVSKLIGLAKNKGIELVESYQIDRVNGIVLFTKSRIGTATVLPNGPDIASVFVGKVEWIKE